MLSLGGIRALLNLAGCSGMTIKPTQFVVRTGICLGFLALLGGVGCSNASSYTRVPPPGTWGSASNSYYSLPGNSWTPAAPGAIGSGVPAASPTGVAPPTGAAQPTASNPTLNKTTQTGTGSSSTSGTSPTGFTSMSGNSTDLSSGVQTAAATGGSNPVRIAVFSDEDADDSQVVPAGSGTIPSGTTTVPASQLPWRNP